VAQATAKHTQEKDNLMNTKLTNAVIKQLGGRESLEDIANHGIDGGFTGFIYYSDTVKFFKKNRALILELAKEMASDLGENVIDMIAGFNCLTDDDETRESIARCLWGRVTDNDTQVANALAWFAAEEVARTETDN
jgi:hypothetical protein